MRAPWHRLVCLDRSSGRRKTTETATKPSGVDVFSLSPVTEAGEEQARESEPISLFKPGPIES